MSELYKCGICGVITEEKSQICDVESLKGKEDYCSPDHQREQMCHDMKEQASYVCNSCGRPADQPEHLCSPRLS